MKFFKKIKSIYERNGLILMIVIIKSAILNRFTKRAYSYIYGFEGAWFGKAPLLVNIKRAKIGKNFYAERFLRFEIIMEHHNKKHTPVCIIGDNVRISDLGHIGCCNKLTIGDNVLIGSKVYISDHGHGLYSGNDNSMPSVPPNDRELFIGTVEIGNNVYIGDGVVILPNVKIGDGAIIAANSVITSGSILDPNSIYAGAPARKIKVYNKQLGLWAFPK